MGASLGGEDAAPAALGKIAAVAEAEDGGNAGKDFRAEGASKVRLTALVLCWPPGGCCRFKQPVRHIVVVAFQN
eukprot:13163644-Alexandrium_andersonii.AAC.1